MAIALDRLKLNTKTHTNQKNVTLLWLFSQTSIPQECCVYCGVCTCAVYILLCISVCTCSWIPVNRSQKLTFDVRFYHSLCLLFTARSLTDSYLPVSSPSHTFLSLTGGHQHFCICVHLSLKVHSFFSNHCLLINSTEFFKKK